MNNLEWIQDGLNWKAQGHRRVYCIESSVVGDNRFVPVIARGVIKFVSIFPCENLEDAKGILQRDHDSIEELIRDNRQEI